MSRMGIESGPSFSVVENGGIPNEVVSDVFRVRELSEGRFQITHPFHGPRTIGDGSVFSDRYVDTATALLLEHLPYLADSRKLNRIGRFETRPYASLYSQLSHCVSLGIMGAEFAGGPLDIFDGVWNDACHTYNGHQGDDNYQGHGREDLHDYDRGDFFVRSGVIGKFIENGVLRPNGHGYHFGQTRLYIGTLLNEDEATVRRTFMSNKHPARRMDNDRFQYGEEERLFTELFRHRNSPDAKRVPHALAAMALDDIQRLVVLDDGEGDQLVFGHIEVAERSTLSYAEKNALHWCEPVQDLVNDLLNLAERYFFVCDHPLAREFQYFYPRDYLHTSASLMFERFFEVAKTDPFMKWVLDEAEALAADQRSKMADIIDEKSGYDGPSPIDGVTFEKIELPEVASSFRVVQGKLMVTLPKGKLRTVDPRVITGKTQTVPLSTLRPELFTEITNLHRWIGNYRAEIAIEDLETEVFVREGIALVEERWPKALKKLYMPEGEFKRNIAEANSHVKKTTMAA